MSEIIKQDLGVRMATSYLSYADYVIRDRALPDIRDGLKPVHRRILYSMQGLGLQHNKSYKKCARTVGDVLGRYHPHGDSSVYGAMVKLAQEFNMRYPLVNGHGNFGSLDGDGAAAMRYTEAKLSLYGETMMNDIAKDAVTMVPNFDDSETEPEVLPTLFPNLLANGTTGIAVGMGTSIPPHNAADLYKALDLIIVNELEQKETNIDDLIKIVKAPDFPTGATIIDLKGVEEGYKTGHGRVIIRSKYHIEEQKNHESIVITEIPYKVNKATMVEQIDALRKDQLENEIKEVRDESDKDGIRVVVELKKDISSPRIVKKLLKFTQMQDNFSMNMLALINGRPVQFTLKEAMEQFLAHVANVILHRTAFDLEKAEARKHIVEGIISCLDRIDEVIATIKASKTNAAVITNLMNDFGLTEVQAKAIADMRLKALSQASYEDYQAELDELNASITKWQAIINDQSELLKDMRAELKEVATIYKGGRKTDIKIENIKDIDERELIKEEDLVVTFTTNGLIKSVSESDYSTKGRRTKGQKAANMKEDDSIRYMATVHSKDDLLFFTNHGRCHVLEAFKIPITTRTTAGKSINNYLTLDPEEKIVSMLSITPNTEGDLLFVTKGGVGKRLELNNLSTKFSVTKVMTFRDNDELVSCTLIKKDQEVLVLTAKGQGIRFHPDAEGAKGIRPMGRTAAGVCVAKLGENDSVVDVLAINGLETFLVMTEKGYSKRLAFSDFSTISRGTQGVRVCLISDDKTGDIVGALPVADEDDLFIASKDGKLSRISVKEIRVMGRQAAGVRTINLSEKDTVVSVSKDATE